MAGRSSSVRSVGRKHSRSDPRSRITSAEAYAAGEADARRRKFSSDERILATCEAVDAFEAEQGVDTTPQVLIGGERLGGNDELERYLAGQPWGGSLCARAFAWPLVMRIDRPAHFVRGWTPLSSRQRSGAIGTSGDATVSLNHADYYLRRERVARDLAARAADPSVSRIHAVMADRYAELAVAAAESGRSAHRPSPSDTPLQWVR